MMSVDQAMMAALDVVRSLRRNDGAVARDGREGEGPGPFSPFWAAPIQLSRGPTAYSCARRRLGHG
jgi:hypothetical protein